MWVMEYSGRYRAQRGIYFAAQQPSTMRWSQGFMGEGGTEAMVEARRRIIVGASTSSW